MRRDWTPTYRIQCRDTIPTEMRTIYVYLWWSMLSSCMNRTASAVDTGAGRYIIFTALQLKGTYLSVCWGVVFSALNISKNPFRLRHKDLPGT